MIHLLAFHALLGLVCLLADGRLGRRALLLAALGPLATVGLLVRWSSSGLPVTETIDWLPDLGLELAFRFDGLSALMVGLVGGVGALVFVYSWFYFGERRHLGRFAGYLVLFAGAMVGLVTADNLLLLFVFWELTSVMSYLLIGFDDESAGARASALQALLVTGVGGLAMLAGIVILAEAGGSYLLSDLLASPPSGASVGVGLGLVLVGAFSKSAQFPFHFWLPGAMAAPTPVSAYLHSATMVKAGIYLVARLAPVFAVSVGWWRPVLAVVGLLTMLVGGWRAMAQHDLKLLLAQGTVSQLGLIMLLVGWGSPAATFAGVGLILAHALFKGALFMAVGVVDHQAHSRDIRHLSGLRHHLKSTFRLSVVAVASMVGLPPLLGFVVKESALGALVADAPWAVVAAVVVGSMLTVAYGLRFLTGAFGGQIRDESNNGSAPARPTTGFEEPAALLAGSGLILGILPSVANWLVSPGATAANAGAAGEHMELWHGLTLPLLLSGIALAGGWLAWRRPLEWLRSWTRRAPEATKAYGATLEGVNRFADRLTSVVQSGSLPVYLAVILSVAVAGPIVVMIASGWTGLSEVVVAESPIQVVAAGLVAIAAVGTVLAKRRLGAVLLLGAVGYGIAVLFVIQGAPDLALTQLLIETLVLALFVMVLSRLPARFEWRRTRIRQVTRLGVSTAVGVSAMLLSWWAISGRVAPSLASDFIARAEPDGGGRNVVNVILTDFRALDTLGEITVLAVAALGAISLVTALLPSGSRDGHDSEEAGG